MLIKIGDIIRLDRFNTGGYIPHIHIIARTNPHIHSKKKISKKNYGKNERPHKNIQIELNIIKINLLQLYEILLLLLSILSNLKYVCVYRHFRKCMVNGADMHCVYFDFSICKNKNTFSLPTFSPTSISHHF